MEAPPPKYFRLRPGGEVRLKYAFIIKCEEVVKDGAGNVVELRCTADLDSKSGGATANRKVKDDRLGQRSHAVDAEVRLYDRLFTEPEPDAKRRFPNCVNPNSLEVVTARCEPRCAMRTRNLRYQFERLGYFTLDKDHLRLIGSSFNRTITLKDAWVKEAKKS